MAGSMVLAIATVSVIGFTTITPAKAEGDEWRDRGGWHEREWQQHDWRERQEWREYHRPYAYSYSYPSYSYSYSYPSYSYYPYPNGYYDFGYGY